MLYFKHFQDQPRVSQKTAKKIKVGASYQKQIASASRVGKKAANSSLLVMNSAGGATSNARKKRSIYTSIGNYTSGVPVSQ